MDIKQVYNNIATHFDKTRYSVWSSVRKYIDTFSPGQKVLEIGCGNGKNMLYRSDLDWSGIDISSEMVTICKSKNLNVIEASMTNIPFPDEIFDGCLVIASYHHLNNEEDRIKALNEFYRILKINGKIIIQVWAQEQPLTSKFVFKAGDNFVPWLNRVTGQQEQRYYNIYPANKLREEIGYFCPKFDIKKEYWEKGNWILELQKN
jgi:ubiquinone/menaquinone biosynthesis C-methylase UbiE